MRNLFSFLLIFLSYPLLAQNSNDSLPIIDYKTPNEYYVAGIKVTGTKFLDKEVLTILSGIKVGDKIQIPGDRVAKAVKSLWKQGLFDNVQILIDSIDNNYIYLLYNLNEKPRITRFAFSKNLKRSDVDNINEKIKDFKGRISTPGLVISIKNIIQNYFIDKGYWNVQTNITEINDTITQNGALVKLQILPGKKVKIGAIHFDGNSQISDKKLKKTFKETKVVSKFNIFRGSKFIQETFDKDKQKLEEKYHELGYRNARILSDSIYKNEKGRLVINVKLVEGNRFFFKDISFVGNTVYPDSTLAKVLGIKKGDLFNESILEQRLSQDPNGRDISALYMDDGYLFFQAQPIEKSIENDSIVLEIRITEGVQATINKVTITGNDKTNDHVVLREMRTRPGQKFSRTDIQRTVRELAQLGYFDPEKTGVNPVPNPNDGTVDVNYTVTERSNDQVELSGGWGANRVVGSLGLTLNNFSAKKLWRLKAWRPVPSGDGQRLSIRAQSNGIFFQSYNFSFTEPWLGGKKPNSFSVSIFHSIQNINGRPLKDPLRQGLNISGISLTLGKRLKKPDDFFTVLHSVNFQQYDAKQFGVNQFFQNGISNNFNFRETISRNSIDQPIYPRNGSQISLSVQFTPPYSLFNKKNYSELTTSQRYNLIEYHKWRFDATWYHKLDKASKLVLHTRVQLGFLGNYNNAVGEIPFGRFYLGGSGINNFQLDDRELLALRGYQDNSITPVNERNAAMGGAAFQKYVVELRYPVSLLPSATIWLQTFLEAGNNFRFVRDFNPFKNYRSAGVGVRVFLPMFGLLGLDWGYGFDRVPWSMGANKGNIAVSIGQQF